MSSLNLFENPLAFGMYYFPEHFTDVSPTFHVEILNAVLSSKYLAVVAPRGSSKSTLLTFLFPAWAICFKRQRHIVLLQSTFEKAATSIATITDAIRGSELIGNDFGISVATGDGGKDTKGEVIFVHPLAPGETVPFRTRIIGKGAEQMSKLRGEKFGAYRPDLIIMDDLEDDVSAKNQELRVQTRDLFNRAVVKCVAKAKHQIIAIGTVFHDDCLISRLVHKDYYPEYKKLFYQVRMSRQVFDPATSRCEKKEYSLWPERWSMDEIKQDEVDDPDTFSTEMMNNPSSGTAAKFKKADFRNWRIDGDGYILFDGEGTVIGRGKLRDCQYGISCDLAWEERRTSDYSVAMPGFLTPSNEILIDTYLCKRGLRPDELFEWLFVASARLQKLTGSVGYIGFEKAKLEKVVKWLLEKEMRKRGEYLLLKDLLWDHDKLQRIYTRLQPRYAQHVIYHQKGMEELEYQLIRIPSGTHDDLCLSAGTKIATPSGDRNIEDIKVGEYVRTTRGFRQVSAVGCTGYREEYSYLGLTGTANHPIITKKGIKRLDSIHVFDILYIWNAKQYCIEERSIIDILAHHGGNIESIFGDTINGKPRLLRFIDKYLLILLGAYQEASSFIIRMKTRLIMIRRTLNVCRDQSICDYTQVNQKELKLQCLTSELFFTPTITSKKLGIGTKVLKVMLGMLLTPKRVSAKNLIPVYNLTVEYDNEYFANGILVHNCDSLQGLVQLLQFPKDGPKPDVKKTAEDEFNWWRKITIDAKKPAMEKVSPYPFGKRKRIEWLPASRSYR